MRSLPSPTLPAVHGWDRLATLQMHAEADRSFPEVVAIDEIIDTVSCARGKRRWSRWSTILSDGNAVRTYSVHSSQRCQSLSFSAFIASSQCRSPLPSPPFLAGQSESRPVSNGAREDEAGRIKYQGSAGKQKRASSQQEVRAARLLLRLVGAWLCLLSRLLWVALQNTRSNAGQGRPCLKTRRNT